MVTRKIIANEKIVCYSEFPRGRGLLRHGGHMGKPQGQSRGRRSRKKMWVRAFVVISSRENRQGRVSRFGRFRIDWFE